MHYFIPFIFYLLVLTFFVVATPLNVIDIKKAIFVEYNSYILVQYWEHDGKRVD